MTSARVDQQLDYAVVIPTIGRASLADLVAAVDGKPAPTRIVIADDRREPGPPLTLPATRAPLMVVRSNGRGPAAARNAGWRATESAWVAFLDDDVRVPADWCSRLAADLEALPPHLGASQAWLHVPRPAGQRPTDEQRRTTGLVGAQWITADMAYRRSALLATGGFDERFPRAFREDSDLGLRTIRAGYSIVWGDRVTTHPITTRGGWRSSLRAQAGNADNALLRAKYGRRWRKLIDAGRGRTGVHALTVGCGVAALAAAAARRGRLAATASTGWALLTTEFALERILPGPRTRQELATMAVTSAAIPPLAIAHRLRGEVAVRRAGWRRPRPEHRPRAVLFDRDGTLIENVPYLADPGRVQPVPGAGQALAALRRHGIAVGVISNQSGVARGLITPAQLESVNARIESLLGPFDTWQVCIHHPNDACSCRKPAPGMVAAAADALGVAARDCVLIGDTGADVDAALTAGARAVLVPTSETLLCEVDRAAVVASVAPNLTAAVRRSVGRLA
jgi:histidinol-phosphate phosphatase family protein